VRQPHEHIFLSHATDADGARAKQLLAAIEAGGRKCWISSRDIKAGADWNGAILAAVEQCSVLVLLVSPASISSTFVKAEVQHAFEHGKRIIPVRLVPNAEPARIDLRLKTVQHLHASADFAAAARAIINGA